MKLPAPLATPLHWARQALVGLSSRERSLILFLAVVLALFAVSEVYEQSVQAEIRLIDVRRQVQEAKELKKASSDEQAALARRRAIAKAQALSFRAETFAIARVQAQFAVSRAAMEAGVQGVRVTASPEPAGEGRIRLQPLTIKGTFDWASFLPMVQAMAGGEQSLLFSKLTVNSAAGGQFELTVLAPISTQARASPPPGRSP